MDRNALAKQIFEEIRDRPYRGSVYSERAWNCYFKGLELVERLVTLGFPMRAKIGKIEWEDLPLPPHILSLLPKGSIETHYYPEIFMDNQWKILDPSWNKVFAEKFNLPHSEFGAHNESCFKINYLFNEDEQAQYIAENLLNNDNKEKETNQPYSHFINEMNEWLEEVNP